MKNILLVLCFFGFSFFGHSTTSEKDADKIATFCKVWGFLKYYHPEVAKGETDWDLEFTTRIKTLSSLHSKAEINQFYSDWIKTLGKVESCNTCNNDIADSLTFNLNLDWMEDTGTFSADVIQQLIFIKENRNQGNNYHVNSRMAGNAKFEHEKAYEDSVYPSPELRLLGLSRYWNIIDYFYPYKYALDQDWDSVLVEMTPKFKDAPDTISYHLAMLELTTKINDSHAGFVSRYTNLYFGYKWAPFRYRIIDDKAIVTAFINDSLCRLNDIRIGDVFLTVNEIPISQRLEEKRPYIGASNEATRLRNSNYAVFNGETDSIKTTFERDGKIIQKTVYRYFYREFKDQRSEDEQEAYKIMDGNIGYVNMGALKYIQTKQVLKKLKKTKAIIFDVRNYPNGTMYQIANFLNDEQKAFAAFTTPDLSYPGTFKHTNPYYCGKKNKRAYKGKVIVLFNEETQSHAEFTVMALQTAPDVTCIGSQTAGADGNVSLITFPGNYKTYMTGIGVYYPDGRETQRIGMVPDIEVKPSIEGIRAGRDEVLEKAIALLSERASHQ